MSFIKDRRRFLQHTLVGGASLTTAAGAPHGWLHALAASAIDQDRILVVIQLTGGNDGLNTVVPYADDAYYRARPKLALAADSLWKLDDSFGLHPGLRPLETAVEQGRFAIVQGVGYPQPNRSHFESMDIWHTCQPKVERGGQGWLGRWLGSQRSAGSSSGEALALHLGHEPQPLALAGRDASVPSIASLRQFRLQLGDSSELKQQVARLAERSDEKTSARAGSSTDFPTESRTGLEIDRAADSEAGSEAGSELLDFVQSSSRTAVEASRRLESASADDPAGEFPSTSLGEKLHIVAQLIVGGLATRIYYVTLDGFDTHAQQPAAHSALLRQWSEAQSALLQVLRDRGHGDRVLVVTFSEFGRRVAENASLGTDHGAAAPLFLAGPPLKASVVGIQPSLTDLDDGDLRFHTDFRSVYATVIEKWFGTSSEAVLGKQFQTLDVLA